MLYLHIVLKENYYPIIYLYMESRKDGSEIHRLKPMKKYDYSLFMKMYKLVKPVINNLLKGIDLKRYDVSKDILRDQFYDKMLYVFNKYYGEVDEEHLKANILRALSTYKLHLLKYAYNDKAEFNQKLKSFEDLFDDSKEYVDDNEEYRAKEYMYNLVKEYMDKNLSLDAKLVFECLISPPPFIEDHMKGNRITNILLVEFFELPKTRGSVRYISELRQDIDYWIDRARKELHF